MIHRKAESVNQRNGIAVRRGARTGACRVERVVGGGAVHERVHNGSDRLAAAVFRHGHHRRGDAVFEDVCDAVLNPDKRVPAGSGG
jgi:hypothetical protein